MKHLTIDLDNLSERNNYRFAHKIPYTIKSLLEPNSVWLAGGAIRTVFDDTEVKDYDLYFTNYQYFEQVYGKLLKMGAKTLVNTKRGVVTSMEFHGLKIQLIYHEREHKYDTPQDIINGFDFVPAMFATDGSYLFTTTEAIKCAGKKQLRLNSLQTPVSTLKRILKYREKGYDVPVAFVKELAEAFKSIEEFNWNEYLDELPIDEVDDYIANRRAARRKRLARMQRELNGPRGRIPMMIRPRYELNWNALGEPMGGNQVFAIYENGPNDAVVGNPVEPEPEPRNADGE